MVESWTKTQEMSTDMSMFSRTKTTTATDFEQATQAVADITG
jgi:hypothetical protein